MIDRAVRLAMATSSTTAIVFLVAFNLIPLGGVLFWGWNVATLLVLYWIENGIVGLLNVPKMLLASGPDEIPTRVAAVNEKAVLVPFFLVHYGLFWFVHGVFVFLLLGFAAVRAAPFDPALGLDPGFPNLLGSSFDTGQLGPVPSAVAWGAIGLAISHTASFLINFVGRGEYRRTTAARQMFAPYGRVAILQLTILFGAFVSVLIGSPNGAVVVLILLKTALDLTFHLREHGGVASRQPSG